MINVYKSIEEMTDRRFTNLDLKRETFCISMLHLKSALKVVGFSDDEVIRKLFACYCKLLESKTVYIEKPTGISEVRHREALLRALQAENEIEVLKRKLAEMEQSDRTPQYNLKEGDKIAYKSTVTKEDIIKLMSVGLSQTEIADRLNVSRSTISRRLKE